MNKDVLLRIEIFDQQKNNVIKVKREWQFCKQQVGRIMYINKK